MGEKSRAITQQWETCLDCISSMAGIIGNRNEVSKVMFLWYEKWLSKKRHLLIYEFFNLQYHKSDKPFEQDYNQ